MKLTPRKPINADDNVGRGMDLALVTLVFLGIGWALDAWLGTRPWCTLGLLLLSFVGQFARMWYSYDEAMRQHEDARRENARSQTGSRAA